jgi:MFS family permease
LTGCAALVQRGPRGASDIRNANLLLFLIARFFGVLASQILNVAVGFEVYELTGDPMALGFVGLAQFLPMFALTLVAGDVADRFDRRMILGVSYALQAVLAAGLLALVLTPQPAISMFYLLLALLGSVRAFSAPAGQAYLPLLVPTEQLPRAIAWSSSTFQVATIAGPASGGAALIFGADVAFALCLALFAFVALLTLGITVESPRRDLAGSTVLSRLTAGIAYVRRTPIVLGALSLDLFAVLFGGVTAMLPIYAKDILFVGPEGLGLLRSAPAVGAAVVSIGLGVYPLDRHAGPLMFGCVGVFGVMTIVFGISTSFALSLTALFVLGAADMISVYVRNALVQMVTPDHMRGRVSAVNFLFIGASNELGEFESGLAAAWLGIVPSVVVGGLGTLGVVALWAWMFPSLRNVDRLTTLKAE